MHIICSIPLLFGKMEFSLKFHPHITCDNKYPIPELFTFCVSLSENSLHPSVTTYVEIYLLIAWRNIYIYIYISRPFSNTVIRVSRQCLGVFRKWVKVSMQYLGVSRHVCIFLHNVPSCPDSV